LERLHASAEATDKQRIAELAGKTAEIFSLTTENSRLKASIVQKEHTISEKDGEISHQRALLEEAERAAAADKLRKEREWRQREEEHALLRSAEQAAKDKEISLFSIQTHEELRTLQIALTTAHDNVQELEKQKA
jgi:hypothetical protein